MTYDAVDLFAGPRGWSVGARRLGITDVGLEWDAAACATSHAAGFDTIRADVAAYPTAPFAGIPGLIASPPCQTFSKAGTRDGRGSIEDLARAMGVILDGGPDPRPELRAGIYARVRDGIVAKAVASAKRANAKRPPAKRKAPDVVVAEGTAKGEARAHRTAYNAALVVEPARWVHDLRPQWVALEQVPAVLPLWERLGHLLDDHGYRSWAGILNAADFGVPQTRERAILVARRDGRPALPPTPTHAKRATGATAPDLFGVELEPWVTMAEALGWGEALRPATCLVAGSDSGGRTPLDGGSNSRKARADRLEAGEFIVRDSRGAGGAHDGGGDRSTEFDAADRAARTVGTAARSWTVRTGQTSKVTRRPGAEQVPYERSADEPAPTITGNGGMTVHPADEAPAPILVNTGKDWQKGGTRDDAQAFDATQEPARTLAAGNGGAALWRIGVPGRLRGAAGSTHRDTVRDIEEPAPTIAFGRNGAAWQWEDRWSGGPADDPAWPLDRPASTLAGDPRVPQPGHKKDADNPDSPGQMTGSIRITIDEAAVLQSFPADHPWQGGRQKQFEQVGNAVPPVLAEAVLRAVTG